MECIRSETVNINWFGGVPAAHRVRAVILATEAPNDLTSVTGESVIGLDDNDVLATGSWIITPTANYLAVSDGNFVQKGGGSSGGEIIDPK